MPLTVSLFIHFFFIAFLGIGGFAVTIPDLYRWLVEADAVLSAEAFQSAVALGQSCPGPNVMIVYVLGWFAAGPAGALIGIVATAIPFTSLSLLAGRYFAHNAASLAVRSFRAGMAPVSIALLYASSWTLVAPTLSLQTALATLVSAYLIVRTRVHTLVMIALGALVGVLGWV